jgi:hypothetical protein
MVIKASSATEIRKLVSALGGDDEVRRDAATARLAVIGGRAVDALGRAYEGATDRATKIAVLRALDSIGDGRTVAIARRALTEGGDVAIAATSALRSLLDSPHGPTGADALDALVGTALDPLADRRVRLAALDGLHDMPEGVRASVAEALAADPDPRLKSRALELPRDAAAAESVWQDALEGRLPDDAAALRDAAQTRASSAALSALQKMIDTIRAREGSAPRAARAGWQSLRGALHQALALRGSRVAVYDLRETIEQAPGPIPTSFLAALHVVGDASCLEPIAAAYTRAGSDERWRVQLAAAFRAIAKREKITRRHAVMKRLLGSDLDFPFLAK